MQQTFYEEIPLTRQLGLRVESYNGETLVLYAPLAPNINHKQTAFAGSLNAVITLAGWGLLWLILKEENIAGKIVIQDSTINYLQPVVSDFRAVCKRPDFTQVQRFLNILRKKGVARLELQAVIETEPEKSVLVAFSGRYVAHKLNL